MRRTISGVLLALLVISAVPVLAADEEDVFDSKTAVEQREKGRQLLHSRNYDAAIEALEAAVDAAPDAESYYLLGYAYYMKGKSGDAESREKAKENFEEAYSLNPNFSPNKFKPGEPVPAPGIAPAGDQSLTSAAPASKQAPAPAEQPKQ